MSGAPLLFHFVFGLKPQAAPLHIAHYLCLESCRRVNAPATLHLHYRHEPHGPWWERIRPHLQLHRVGELTAGFEPARYQRSEEGRLIERAGWSYAHEADFLRLEILLRHGGVYADIDTLFVRRYEDAWLRAPFAIGEENAMPDANGILRPSLCNAVMFARAGSDFATRWLAAMKEAFDGTWSRHSCQEAARLWAERPKDVEVIPAASFYAFGSSPRGLRNLFETLCVPHSGIYSVHLWSHLWWDEWRTDMTRFHAGLLTEEYVRTAAATYAVLARPFLPEA
jgi:hypothetical protein